MFQHHPELQGGEWQRWWLLAPNPNPGTLIDISWIYYWYNHRHNRHHRIIINSNSRHSASVLQNPKIKPKPLISTNQHTPLVCQCLYFSSFMWNKVNWLFNKYVSLTFMSRLDEQDIIGNIENIINLIHWYLSCMRYALLAPHASDLLGSRL